MLTTKPTRIDEDHLSRRPQIEKWLDDNGVFWRFAVKPLGEFDVEKSLNNQARIVPLDEAKVEEYTLAMNRGKLPDFPAVVTYVSNKRLVIVDGNHRLGGAVRHGAAELGTYIVTASDEVIRVLTYQANNFNGMPTSQEERLLHAVHLVDMGMTLSDAAAKLGLGENAVKGAISKTQADRRAARLGITRGWAKLPSVTRQRLGAVRTDEGMVEATKLVISAGFTAKETSELVTQMNHDMSAKGQIEIVGQVGDQYKGRISQAKVGFKKPRQFSDFNRFIGTLKIIDGYNTESVAETSNLVGLEPGEFAARCLAASEKLMDIGMAVEKHVKAPSGEEA